MTDDEDELSEKDLDPSYLVVRHTLWGKLYERLRGQGYDSVTQLVKDHPGITFYDLARWKVRPSVWPIVLSEAYASEQKSSEQIRDFSMEFLVRKIRESLPDGWGNAPANVLEITTIRAIARLDGLMERVIKATPEILAAADRTWKALIASNPPVGWLPADITDPLITRAFDVGWPRA